MSEEKFARVKMAGGSMEGKAVLLCGDFPVAYGEPKRLENEAMQINAAFSALIRAKDERIKELEADGKSLEMGMDAWVSAAHRIGEELSENSPRDYYEMSANEWRAWALKAIKGASK